MIGAGWAFSRFFNFHGLARAPEYLYGATALLAVGLYGSTSQISRPAVHRHANSLHRGVFSCPTLAFRPEDHINIRIIGLAVTVGVIVKAALITLVMYVAFHEPVYLVLGVAMAQIDPLSVIALRCGSKLSERAKTVLHAWSSFDDPVTMLLTIYLAAFALNVMGRSGGLVGADLVSFALNLLLNLGFAVGAAIVWWVLTRSTRMRRPADSGDGKSIELSPRLNRVAVVVLVVFMAVAVWQFLLLGLAIAGLFFRPRLGPWLSRATSGALLLASLALGILLADALLVDDALLVGHMAWWHSLVLGVAAFGAHIIVAWPLTRKLPTRDRIFLALSQQSGITAIILALLLERSFPGTVVVVAPAIIVINILHVCTTAAFTSAMDMDWRGVVWLHRLVVWLQRLGLSSAGAPRHRPDGGDDSSSGVPEGQERQTIKTQASGIENGAIGYRPVASAVRPSPASISEETSVLGGRGKFGKQ